MDEVAIFDILTLPGSWSGFGRFSIVQGRSAPHCVVRHKEGRDDEAGLVLVTEVVSLGRAKWVTWCHLRMRVDGVLSGMQKTRIPRNPGRGCEVK